jgi:predicted alpha/beta-hydrolase family hydrolase
MSKHESVATIVLIRYVMVNQHRPGVKQNLRRSSRCRPINNASIWTPRIRSVRYGQVPDAFQPGQTAAVLEDALQPVQAPTHVHVIEGADHSFKVPKRSGRTAEEVLEEIAREMVAWIQRTNR